MQLETPRKELSTGMYLDAFLGYLRLNGYK